MVNLDFSFIICISFKIILQTSTTQKAEEMRLNRSLENMIQKVNDIKAAINQFLYKIDHEHETLAWPSVLDSFALLSSQINSFHKLLGSDGMAALKTYVFVPIQLNPDKDLLLDVSLLLFKELLEYDL